MVFKAVFFIIGISLVPLIEIRATRSFNGRPYNGFINPPQRQPGINLPEEKFYEFQYVNHFDGSDFRYWKQRYFVNDTFQIGNAGPIFLVLGGEAELDPIWAVEGAWIQYAQRYGAALVLLEHRYYGKSQPVKDLSAPNLQYLSSRQALEDAAQFINYYKMWYHISDSAKIIVFGASYSGSLAAWFKSKYPYMVDGAVASSAPLVAQMEFPEYLVDVSRAMELTGPGCVSEVRQATDLIYEWWGQPDKRILMQQIFKLCNKIDHSSLRDWPVMYYKLAENFASVVQYNHDNRAYLGADVNITTEKICDMMRDETRGNGVQRYADVSNLLLEARKETCLDIRYTNLVGSLNYTELDNATTHKGARQWLYQTCAEFGWFQTTLSRKQPFGSIWAIQFNLTTDQCIDLFQMDFYKGIFGGEEVQDNADDTNRFYGGRDLPISNALFVDHEMDPWRNVSAIQHLPNSVNTQIIHVKGRQWLYQQCSELGWIHTSSSPKQPFGQYFIFPFNFTTDQCMDLFRNGYKKGFFDGDHVIGNTIETNMYYGGRDISISNAILVNHEMDPFWNATGPQDLPFGRNTQIFLVKGTSHIADIYPPSDRDPPQLTETRKKISQTLAKWLTGRK